MEGKTNFEEGLKLTVEWYLENRDWLERKVESLRDFWQKVYKR